MQQIGLGPISHQTYAELSDGQWLLLMIARALINGPEVLVLDELSRALDPQAWHQLMACLRLLCHNSTTVVQSHRIETNIPDSVQVLVLKGGRICVDGPPETMLIGSQLSQLFSTPPIVVESDGFCRKDLFRTLGEVSEVVIVRLQKLPDNWNGENDHQTNGGPDGHGVIAVHCLYSGEGTLTASANRG